MTLRIVCDLSPEAVRAGRDGLLPGFATEPPAGRNRTDTSSRSQPTENLKAITDVIEAERQCCRWLEFQLAVQPDGGPMILTLRGPKGAREFLSALF